MGVASDHSQLLAAGVRRAFADHDVHAFGAWLSDDVTWGDTDTPRGCRNRSEVLETFSALLEQGVDGRVTELTIGTAGILCGLEVTWPPGEDRRADVNLFHVYKIRNERIVQIRRFDDRDSAATAAGVSS